jgi:hypothetical protein
MRRAWSTREACITIARRQECRAASGSFRFLLFEFRFLSDTESIEGEICYFLLSGKVEERFWLAYFMRYRYSFLIRHTGADGDALARDL